MKRSPDILEYGNTPALMLPSDSGSKVLISPYFDAADVTKAYLPGSDDQQSMEFMGVLEEILNNGSSAQPLANGTGWVLRSLHEQRQYYETLVRDIQKTWITEGRRVDQNTAIRLSRLRDAVRDHARQTSIVPNRLYGVVDVVRVRDRKLRQYLHSQGLISAARLPKPTPAERIASGKYAAVIDGASKPNAMIGRILKIGGKAGKFITSGGSLFVAGIPITYKAVALYNAETVEEQQNALDELGGEVIEAGAFATASASAGSLCMTFGLASAGWGFLACGLVATTIGLVAGGAAERVYRASK